MRAVISGRTGPIGRINGQNRPWAVTGLRRGGDRGAHVWRRIRGLLDDQGEPSGGSRAMRASWKAERFRISGRPRPAASRRRQTVVLPLPLGKALQQQFPSPGRMPAQMGVSFESVGGGLRSGPIGSAPADRPRGRTGGPTTSRLVQGLPIVRDCPSFLSDRGLTDGHILADRQVGRRDGHDTGSARRAPRLGHKQRFWAPSKLISANGRLYLKNR